MALTFPTFKELVFSKKGPLVELFEMVKTQLNALDARINVLDGAGEIELTQLEHSTEGKIIVYNASGVAEDVAISGDATIAANGAITIGDKKVTAAKTAIADGKVLIGGSEGAAAEQTISGDATLANTGSLTIANNAVTSSKMAIFQSTEQIGDGNPQNVAHGLGVSPSIVIIELTSVGTDGATYTYTKGTTNVVVTCTAGAKYIVHAIA